MSMQEHEDNVNMFDEYYINVVVDLFNTLAMHRAISVDVLDRGVQEHIIKETYLNDPDVLSSLSSLFYSSYGVFGITDPIGQLQNWIYARLTEISSFFSSVVDALVSPIKRVVDSIWSYIQGIGSIVYNALSGILYTILGSLASIGSSLASSISNIWTYLQQIGTIVSSSVKGFIDWLWTNIQESIRIVSDTVKRFLDWLWSNIQSGFSTLSTVITKSFDYIWSGIQNIGTSLLNVLSGIYNFVKDLGTSIISAITSSVKGFLDWLWTNIQGAIKTISDAVKGFAEWLWTNIQSVLKSVSDAIKGFVTYVWDGIQSIGKAFAESFSRLFEFLRNIGSIVASALKGFFDWLWSGIQSVGQSILSIFKMIWDGIQSYFKSIADMYVRIWDGLQGIGRWLWDGIQTFFRAVSDLIRNVLDSLYQVGKTIIDGVQFVGRWVWDGIQGVSRWLGGVVADGFGKLGDAMSTVAKIFDRWATALMGGINNVISGMQKFIEFVVNLPSALQNVFKGVIDFFTKIGESISNFVKDPSKWISENIVVPVWNGLVWLGGKLLDALKLIWDWIVKGFSWIGERIREGITAFVNWVKSGVKWLVDMVSSGVQWLLGAFKEIGMKIYEPFTNMFRWITSPSSPDMVTLAYEIVKKDLEKIHRDIFRISPPILSFENISKAWISTFFLSIPMFIFFQSLTLPIKGIGHAMKLAGKFFEGLSFRLKLSGEPLGVGGALSFMFLKPFASLMGEVGNEISTNAGRLIDPLWLGIGLWFGRSITPLFTFYLRNFIPLEYPSYREAEEMFLRAKAADVIPRELGDKGEDIANIIVDFMKVRGYSDYLLKVIFADVNEYYLVIEDRFKTRRIIPLADVWKIPSPSDLISMLLRDVIIEPEYFTKIMKAIGLTEDISALYFLLRFRYPPPEKLADFYWRGVAGVLWYDQTLEEPRIKDVMKIGKVAKKPIQLNFDVKTLEKMLMSYMKWHDYAPFAWEDDFPTDKSIIVELMADLPDKVDFRWMTRWGIIEHLSKLGVGMKTPIHDIVKAMTKSTGLETVARNVTPEISLDVSLLARFLESKGVHPYFSSLAAVAEAHVMLADEMTLLRTGFLELFRWGLSDLNTLEHLMSGLFVITFTTGYISHTLGEPVTFTYKKPIYWLPAERRLLEIRAVIDRAYELWRLVVREAASGVMRLALKPDEARNIIEGYGIILKDVVRRQIMQLTGIDWSPTIDEEYVDMWVKYGEILRSVESRTWIRHYATRLIAWIMYRTSYGWTPIERFTSLTSTLVSMGWLTAEEKQFLDVIAEWIYGVVRREMIPTPIQLATFSEYMYVPDEIIDKVLKDHRVPEEYENLYRQYISYRYIKSDFKTYLNRFRRAYVLGIVSDEEWTSVLNEAISKYGFREKEIDLMSRLAELEERIEQTRIWRPSITTIISMSEVVPIPNGAIHQILSRFKVPDITLYVDEKNREVKLSSFVMEYAKRRPLIDELRSLVNEYYRLKFYASIYGKAIPRDIEDQVLKYMDLFGLTETEKALRDLVVRIKSIAEEWKEEWRESLIEHIPTPSMLASIYEYVPRLKDEDIIQILSKRGVGKEYIGIWLEYIKNRAIADEVRRLVDAYYRLRRVASTVGYIVPEETIKAVMDYAKKYGFTDEELRIRMLISNIESDIDLVKEWAKEYIPTPSMLATIYEYLPVLTDKEIEMALRKRHVPEEWLPIWMRYIKVKPIADDVRSLMYSYYRLKRYSYIYGQTIPRDIEDEVAKYFEMAGVTESEKAIRALTAYIDMVIDSWRSGETIPTLSTLAMMAEYIEIPYTYIDSILKQRRVDSTYAQLWYRYLYARMISTEVNRVVSAFTALYIRYAVPEDVVSKVFQLMYEGGWTKRELDILKFELELRRTYRIITLFVPTVRQFIFDGIYLPGYEQIFEDLIKTYGLEVEKYKKQIEYYKRLLKNRRMWRHFAWYRTQLTYAYIYGAMDEKTIRAKLQQFVTIGLVDQDEIEMIVDGIKVRSLAEKYRIILAERYRKTS